MREPRLYLSFGYSFCLHLLLLAIVSFFLLNRPTTIKTQKTYQVAIVSELAMPSPPEEISIPSTKNQSNVPSDIQPKREIPRVESQRVQKRPLTNTSIEERISEIKAKKRLEALASLRKEIDISNAKQLTNKTQTASSQTGQKGVEDYLSLIRTMIMQKWVYPDRIDKDLEAIISIRIQKDGRVSVVGIEKSSGNRLFDRSALSAITSLSVLPKPPDGVEEVGIRFKP